MYFTFWLQRTNLCKTNPSKARKKKKLNSIHLKAPEIYQDTENLRNEYTSKKRREEK